MCTACKLTPTNLSSLLVTWSNEAFNPQFPRQKMQSSWEHYTSHFHCMFRTIQKHNALNTRASITLM